MKIMKKNKTLDNLNVLLECAKCVNVDERYIKALRIAIYCLASVDNIEYHLNSILEYIDELASLSDELYRTEEQHNGQE